MEITVQSLESTLRFTFELNRIFQLLEALRNTSVDINGTKLDFDENGNPSRGYDIIQWIWNPSGEKFRTVGGYLQEQLTLNASLIQWGKENSTVILLLHEC